MHPAGPRAGGLCGMQAADILACALPTGYPTWFCDKRADCMQAKGAAAAAAAKLQGMTTLLSISMLSHPLERRPTHGCGPAQSTNLECNTSVTQASIRWTFGMTRPCMSDMVKPSSANRRQRVPCSLANAWSTMVCAASSCNNVALSVLGDTTILIFASQQL